MVEIHESRVSPLGDGIFLWVNVIDGPDYANVYLEKIAIVQYDKFTIDYPDSQNILMEFKGDNLEDKKEFKMTIFNVASTLKQKVNLLQLVALRLTVIQI